MSEVRVPRSRKNKNGAAQWWLHKLFLILLVLLAAAAAATVAYVYHGRRYTEVFFPQTEINGMDASEKTVEEMKREIESQLDGYRLTVELRGGGTETITLEEIGLHSVFDGALEKMLEEQNPNTWFFSSREKHSYEIPTMIAYDEEALKTRVQSLECMQEENSTAPQDASLSEYVEGQGYHIVAESEGTQLDETKTIESIAHAVMNLQTSVNLEEEDCYVKPTVTQENEDLVKQLEAYNRYAKLEITMDMGEGVYETIPSSTIYTWVTVKDDLSVTVDETKVDEYVKSLAKKYNTAYTKRTFKTTSGKTVTVTKGDYGWRINQSAEKKALLSMIKSGESGKREVEYYQKGAVHSSTDWGSTYVEINLTAQHLYFYKNGKLVVESDFVSGNLSKGYDTPAGIYGITYTERNATLKGENYRTPVSYWMPFNGNIGMHDANWRSSFGGSIYKTNGSHGCVNLPPSVAKTIFENIKKNDPVICYQLEGTESSKTSSDAKETTAAETTA
ncbi:MAG: L,D-transpeptidase/peptidoglycan binding protein, partial [bacterium]|nr:L,D-transpeptidase/peptidoglycan binding protein [bacterium]